MYYVLKSENLDMYYSRKHEDLNFLTPVLDFCTKFPNLVAAVKQKRIWEKKFGAGYGELGIYKFTLQKVKI